MKVEVHGPGTGFSPSKALRVLLVDDSWSFLGAAVHFLSMEPDLQVVGCASSAGEALDRVGLLRPDLVLMDVSLPHMNGMSAARRLKNSPNPPRLVLLSVNDDASSRDEAAAIGVDGFLSKSKFGSDLVPMIRGIFSLSPT